MRLRRCCKLQPRCLCSCKTVIVLREVASADFGRRLDFRNCAFSCSKAVLKLFPDLGAQLVGTGGPCAIPKSFCWCSVCLEQRGWAHSVLKMGIGVHFLDHFHAPKAAQGSLSGGLLPVPFSILTYDTAVVVCCWQLTGTMALTGQPLNRNDRTLCGPTNTCNRPGER